MDGRGRALDNVFVERLWRSLKCEAVYLNEYESVREARSGIHGYLQFCNEQRLHQSLDYKTPREIYLGSTSGNQQERIKNLGSPVLTLNKLLWGLIDGEYLNPPYTLTSKPTLLLAREGQCHVGEKPKI